MLCFWMSPQQRRNFAVAALPGMLGAVIFSMAVLGQVITIITFGDAIGMPLTQLNLVVAGLWGIFYYQEIQGTKPISLFVFAMLMATAGGVLL